MRVSFASRIQIAIALNVLWVLLIGCAHNVDSSSHAAGGHAAGEVFGEFEDVDVSGEIVELNNTIPRDGSQFIFKLRTKTGEIVALSLRGPSRHYEPSDFEMTLYRGAQKMRVGDWVQVTLNGSKVVGFRI